MRRLTGLTHAIFCAPAAALVLILAVMGTPSDAHAVPQPIHEWNFATGTANDQVGNLNGTLNGNATIANGMLVLDGNANNGDAYMSTGFSTDNLTAMTLVSWVSLGTLSQGGGSALSVVNSSQNFDAIDFGERTTDQWMNGSDFFNRSLANNGGAIVSGDALHMLAITYGTSGIEIYLDGQLYADGGAYGLYDFADPQYLIGLRHPAAASGNGFLTADIAMDAVFSSTLSASDVATLYSQGGGAAVPEPASVALVLSGLSALRLVRRRRS